jgi:hypothetical protein
MFSGEVVGGEAEAQLEVSRATKRLKTHTAGPRGAVSMALGGRYPPATNDC